MEELSPQRPPDITPVTFDELRAWELGTLALSPEQIVGALALQRALCEVSDVFMLSTA